jgi:hypothetical protein
MTHPIEGRFTSPSTFKSNVSGREIRGCERGPWAAVKHFFGQNVRILVNSERGLEHVYVPLSKVREHLEAGKGPTYHTSRGIERIFASVLGGPPPVKNYEEAAFIDRLGRNIGIWDKIPTYLKYDREFLTLAVGANFEVLKKLPRRLQNDKSFLMFAICSNFEAFSKLPEKLQNDRQFRLDVLARNSEVLQSLHFESPEEQRTFLLEAVSLNPHVFAEPSFPAEYKEDPEFKAAYERARQIASRE